MLELFQKRSGQTKIVITSILHDALGVPGHAALSQSIRLRIILDKKSILLSHASLCITGRLQKLNQDLVSGSQRLPPLRRFTYFLLPSFSFIGSHIEKVSE